MNKNQVKGRVKKIEGTIKEVAGKTFGNEHLEERGKIEKTVGAIQAGLGDLKEDLNR
ncbi:CsbD family protein [Pseudomonas sp. R32]|uniref:CsbD family protein n=1 Tax=Pseudomonas sp. R32 TaxID=1573704 RepID=UPI00132F3A72|nr:CsbD family protein [Pseudomonas sp. R32]QHF28373.1 hypothetical protein PspR32_11400 [Pseudomonas sp. R32]